MIYFNIAIIFIFVILLIITAKDSKEWLKILNRKEHKLYFLYPFIWKIITITRSERFLLRKSPVNETLKALEVTDKPETSLKLYWCQKISNILLVLFLFHCLSLLGQLSMNNNPEILKDQYIIRPDIGYGDNEVDLKVTIESQDPEREAYIEEFKVIVSEREYTEKELEEAFHKGYQYLKEVVLGNNEDSYHITEDLYFLSRISGTGLRVEWRPDNKEVIDKDGKVHNEDIDPEGVATSVKAILSYQNKKREYSMEFMVLPKALSEKELLLRDIGKELQRNSEQAREENKWVLPGKIRGYSLTWEETKQNPGVTMIIFGILTAFFIWIYGDKELERKMEKRKRQLLMDYPEIINKFTLLVNAGMTIKQAWFKITEDYMSQHRNKTKDKRYAYEEMLLMVHELKLGIPEGEAYEKFGRRMGILPYMKLSSLITQNLKKGGKGLSELLKKEAMDAFAERKEIAKRLGEEAGTKLLGPMMIMLMIVLVIIIVPAFLSFGL